MNQHIKKLGKETLVYGTSTVLARLLNFCLVPFYTYYLATADYGIISTIFALLALMNVIYLFGLDQAYLRFASEHENKKEVFLHSFYGVLCWGAVLSVLLFLFSDGAAHVLGISASNGNLLRLSVFILFLDVLNMIPFTKLRLQHKAWYFASVRTLSIVINVALNIIFLAVLKWGMASILWANIFASLTSLICLSPVIFEEIGVIKINKDLRRKMFGFAWPFVPSGMASIMVNVIDKPLIAYLAGLSVVGIYQANFKVGVFMMLIVSMFDQAWRPFFLQHAKEEGHKELFAKIFTLFFSVSMLAALGISFLMPDIIRMPIFGKHFIHPNYWGGMQIIPFVIFGYFFYGLYINFMVAPILTKKTKVLLLSTILGAVVSVCTNIFLVPRIGVTGAGVAILLSYISMALTLFIFLQINYPIKYDYKRLGLISACALAAGGASYFLHASFIIKILILIIFTGLTFFIVRPKRVSNVTRHTV